MKSKKHQNISSKIDKSKLYSLDEAIDFIKKNPVVKFEESIEAHIHLGINPIKTEQKVRGSILLPNPMPKKIKIVAFVSDKQKKSAKEAGADLVGGEDLIDQISKEKKCNFDIAVAEPAMMQILSKIAKVLGPKGLMPSEKAETLGNDVSSIIKQIKAGKIFFRNDAGANIHCAIGKSSWEAGKIKENLDALLTLLKKIKPSGTKGEFIRKIFICSTMGPAIEISL
ncbi:50S ribosomal protein L1 [Patescibacteria group bacterium]|nr:50S ribosomal protein L1 [Patescibacteria group bacterium]